MKIILLGRYSESEILSGPEKVAKRLFEQFASSTNTVTFITYFFDGGKYGLMKKLFGKKEAAGKNASRVITLGIVRMIPYLINNRADIVHIVSYERIAIIPILLKSFLQYKIIYTCHGLIKYENVELKRDMTSFYRFRDRICEKMIFRFADALVFVSRKFLTFSSNYYQLDPAAASVILNAADEIFKSRVERTIPPDRKLKIVFNANPNRFEKSFPLLLKALELIREPVEIFIVSDESYTGLETLNRHQVIYQRRMKSDEYARFMKDKDILTVPSSYEPFSLVTVEAMGLGVVPIVSSSVGAAELIENGRNGYIFELGNAAALAQVIQMLNGDRELLRDISARARESGRQLSWQNAAKDYLKLYAEIAGTE